MGKDLFNLNNSNASSEEKKAASVIEACMKGRLERQKLHDRITNSGTEEEKAIRSCRSPCRHSPQEGACRTPSKAVFLQSFWRCGSKEEHSGSACVKNRNETEAKKKKDKVEKEENQTQEQGQG